MIIIGGNVVCAGMIFPMFVSSIIKEEYSFAMWTGFVVFWNLLSAWNINRQILPVKKEENNP